jgi:hypothetical protein
MQVQRPISLTCQTIILLHFFGNSVVLSSDLTFPLPDGWRLPTVQEADNWYRKGTDKFLSAVSDFNGDNRQDIARLLIRKDDSIVGLLVLVSDKSDDSKLFSLVTTDIQSGIKGVGVETVKPGSYTIACGKGHWNCREDEFPILEIPLEGINLFIFESAASYYYWDQEKKGFVEIWISD